MTIVGPFLLAVVLPLHFFFNTKELLGAERNLEFSLSKDLCLIDCSKYYRKEDAF
jgi:hypothetical protein